MEEHRLPHLRRQSRISHQPDNSSSHNVTRRTVNFAGFHISNAMIEPLPKCLDADLGRDFPIPKSMTDVQSWLGLVNQVTNGTQLRDTMRPCSPLLSPKKPFCWQVDLEIAFQATKSNIIEANIYLRPTKTGVPSTRSVELRDR